MTTNELENLVTELREQLRQAKEPKPSALWRFWNEYKHVFLPFILGVIFGGLFVNIPTPAIPVVNQQTSTLEQQAALGGAAIPFPNDSPSPNPSASPPRNSTAESTASLWTSISEPPSPPNLQADNGQKRLTRLFRLPLRRIR